MVILVQRGYVDAVIAIVDEAWRASLGSDTVMKHLCEVNGDIVDAFGYAVLDCTSVGSSINQAFLVNMSFAFEDSGTSS